MRKSLCVGILRESRELERRAPLTPKDVKWLAKRGIRVEIESSPIRVFKDEEYKEAGAKVLHRFKKAKLLLGIKGQRVEDLYPDKVYMTFSHTTKGQPRNLPLLRACMEKHITLIDYEKITDLHGKRLVYFGRFAGICGLVDSFHYFGEKLEWERKKTPFSSIRPAHRYGSLKQIKSAVSKLSRKIRSKGFDGNLSPFIIGITGHGNVARGVQEVLNLLNPVEVHPRDMHRFTRHQKGMHNKIYKISFLREEKFRTKDKRGFYIEEYMKHPERFRTNMDKYLPYLNMLIHTSYWDRRFPRLVTKKMVNELSRKKPFRLKFIGDISCDINGSVELTHKTTTQDDPTFTYDPKTGTFADGYKSRGITILAVDNLPSELPKDASQEFSGVIRDYVYQIAAHGARDITRHAALPAETRRAVIVQGGKLIKAFKYLEKWV